MRENLWLNLSDGHIGSGRRQWDGSGGTNGALEHYKTTKELNPPVGFPLVVKLGTITLALTLTLTLTLTSSSSCHAMKEACGCFRARCRA